MRFSVFAILLACSTALMLNPFLFAENSQKANNSPPNENACGLSDALGIGRGRTSGGTVSGDGVQKATPAVVRERFSAPSVEIADEVDRILDRLEARYGSPKVWRRFPIYFQRYTGNGIAGYTQYTAGAVQEVVVYESLDVARGGTLDHELTHAFWFYLLNSNFDLFLNEGLAQNSEYRRRDYLRQTVYRRYTSGEFWDLDKLYGRNRYDSTLLIYHEGFSVVDFLIGRGGSEWIVAFMDALTASGNIDRELFRFYGYKSLGELQTEWELYIAGGQDRQSIKAVR